MAIESPPSTRTYMGRALGHLSPSATTTGAYSSVFSECNSDGSGDCSTAASSSSSSSDESHRHPWPYRSAAVDSNSGDLVSRLVSDLASPSIDKKKCAAMEIRLLAKNNPENRLRIASFAGAVERLISIAWSSNDPELQEQAVTAILNLALCDENKYLILSSGAIRPLVRALKDGTPTAKENSACALLRLSQSESHNYKNLIGRSGAIPPLVELLESGGLRGKKDASTALFSLCSVRKNKIRAAKAGVMKPLVELMADSGSGMVDKAACVVSLVVGVEEGRRALVEEGGIPVLVEVVEAGTRRQKEIAAGVLQQICEESVACRTLVAREGAIPPLVALVSRAGTSRAKDKAEALIELLRQPRTGKAVAPANDIFTPCVK